MNTKYDILITVYNKEKYIKRCLESAVNQDFDNYNIIIVNDGSTDSTEEIIKDYLAKYTNIFYYYKENTGVADTRNYAISKSTADFFIFLDADDYLSLNLLKNIDSYCTNEIDIVSFSAYMLDEEKHSVSKIIKDDFISISGKDAIFKFCNSCAIFDVPWGYSYRSDFFKQHNFKYLFGTEHEDSSLTPIIIATAARMTSLEYLGYYYVQNPDSITHNKNTEQKRIIDKFNHLKTLSKFYNSLDLDAEKLEILNNKILYVLLDITTYIGQENLDFYIQQFKKMNMYEILPNNSKTNQIYRYFLKYFPKIPVLFCLSYMYLGDYNKFNIKTRNFLLKMRADGREKYLDIVTNPRNKEIKYYYYIMRIKRMLLFNKNIICNLHILNDKKYIFLEKLEMNIMDTDKFDIKNIFNQIDVMLKITNHINKFVISGSEILFNEKLGIILEKLIKIKKISNIIVVTNSLTLPRNPYLISKLKNKKVMLHIIYNHKLNEKGIKNIKYLKKLKINFRYKSNKDNNCDDISYLKYINKQLSSHHLNKCILSNGKLYFKDANQNLNEYLNILDSTCSNNYKKSKLIELLNSKENLL